MREDRGGEASKRARSEGTASVCEVGRQLVMQQDALMACVSGGLVACVLPYVWKYHLLNAVALYWIGSDLGEFGREAQG
jgi:hypothetical protein